MQLSTTLPFPVVYILKTLRQNGHQAYLVGGAVRDCLLHSPAILDWDITTSATPEQTMALFTDSFCDNEFGTVMVAPEHIMAQVGKTDVTYPDLDVFDITTYRSESGYTDRRHPEQVSWGSSLEEDTKRRDFTINALALDIDTDTLIELTTTIEPEVTVPAQVIDHQGGLPDLDNRVIRTVGDPEARFQEDALRMMRAVRIAAQLGFSIDPETLSAITDNAHLIKDISSERVRDELFKIIGSDNAADGIMILDGTGLLQYILPELTETKGVAQGGRHKYDVWKHSVESLRFCPSPDPLTRLATLLHDIGKPRTAVAQGPRGVTFYGHEVVGAHMTKDIANRLRLSKKDKDKLFTLVRWHMFTYSPEMTDSAIRRFIRHVSLENINDMMMLRIGDRQGGGSKATSWRLRELQQRIGENLYEPLSVKDLKINGHDLMTQLNLSPSPRIGKILNQLFELVMNDELENKTEVLIDKARIINDQLPT